jgi:hypothetical protein
MSDHPAPPPWLLDLHRSLGAVEQAVKAGHASASLEAQLTRESLRKEMAWLQDHVDSRIEDFRREVTSRLDRQDLAIETGRCAHQPPLALRLLVTVFSIASRVPWRALLLAAGALLALIGHWLPAEINEFLRRLLSKVT